MQPESKNDPVTFTGMTAGLVAGICNSWQGSSLLHTVATTAVTATVSCIVSFVLQRFLKRVRE